LLLVLNKELVSLWHALKGMKGGSLSIFGFFEQTNEN